MKNRWLIINIKIVVLAIIQLWPNTMIAAGEKNELAPPEYNVTDPMLVNVVSESISHKLVDVAIGGQLGLEHSISSHSRNYDNSFFYAGKWGPVDNWRGGVYDDMYHCPLVLNPSTLCRSLDFTALTAFGGGERESFRINEDGTYTAVKDPRKTLEFISGVGFVFTTANGTKFISYSPANYRLGSLPGLRASLTKIIFPNGLEVQIHKSNGDNHFQKPINSVTSNTGYQLKYNYEVHNRPLEAAKASATHMPGAEANSLLWSTLFPKTIVGINNAVEYCTTSDSTCSLSNQWPTATHNWPDGMPRAFYIGESVFSVEDYKGGITEFHHTAFDMWVGIDPQVRLAEIGEEFVSRLTGIKEAHSETVNRTFFYENDTYCSGLNYRCGLRGVKHGELRGASYNDITRGYQFGDDHRVGSANRSGGYKAVNEVAFESNFGFLHTIDTWDKVITFDHTQYSNRIKSIYYKIGGQTHLYSYDSRGNVTKITNNGKSKEAEYLPSCTASNRKYCNKPVWTKDRNGNQTDYEYHPESGQLAKITKPANEDGKRPQTRRFYKLYKAKFRTSSTTTGESPTGVYLLDSTSFCEDSNYINETCSGGDEVKTEYEYDVNKNLAMVGVKITTKERTTLTCYEYDIYGNQIAETKPKGTGSTCL